MSGTATIRRTIDSYMETFETGFPGIVSAVNADGTVDAIPSVRNSLSNLQQEGGGGEIRPMRSIPVLWPGTASTLVKFALSEGDPVWLVSGSRDQSGWADGDWADAASEPFRAPSFGGNDLNSLVAIPCRRETHGKAKPTVTVTIGKDGRIELETGADVSVKAGKLELDGDLTVTGKIEADGDISAMNAVPAVRVSLSTHVHATAAGPTDKPTPGV